METDAKVWSPLWASEPGTGLCRMRFLNLRFVACNSNLLAMVLGILTAIAACPAIIGTTEAVRQGQRQSAREKHRGLKTNLSISCSRASKAGREIDGCEVVLSENKVRSTPQLRRSLVCTHVQRLTNNASYISTCHQRSFQTAIQRTTHSQATFCLTPITIGVDRARAWCRLSQTIRHS
jgi:hypothetical protein